MIPDQYAWTAWSLAFLIPWGTLYGFLPAQRKPMLWASLFTAPFGLTEPIFVPSYWNPPSLFGLARTTGFDLESLVFSFGIGGVAAVLYNAITRRRLEVIHADHRRGPRHRFHRWALVAPFLAFVPLYLLPWNPINAAVAAMTVGSAAALLCRPDLTEKILATGGLFLAYYVLFLLGLEWSAPGYIARVWNLEALSGMRLGVIPLEELLFAFAFGMCWAGLYEHVTWTRARSVGAGVAAESVGWIGVGSDVPGGWSWITPSRWCRPTSV